MRRCHGLHAVIQNESGILELQIEIYICSRLHPGCRFDWFRLCIDPKNLCLILQHRANVKSSFTFTLVAIFFDHFHRDCFFLTVRLGYVRDKHRAS